MRRTYVIVPATLLVAFAGYYFLRAPRTAERRFVGDPPFSWSRQDAVTRSAVTLVSGDEYEGRDGALEAAEDLRMGKLRLLGYGLPYVWQAELKEIWKRDYDVESRDLAGCIVTETLVAYASGYNRVMHTHLAERFGADVSTIVSQKARALHAERYPRKK